MSDTNSYYPQLSGINLKPEKKHKKEKGSKPIYHGGGEAQPLEITEEE